MNALGKSAGLAALLTIQVLAQENTSGAGWPGDIAVTAAGTASWVNNLSRTSAAPNRKDAATYELDLTAGRHRQLAPNWLLQVDAEATVFNVPAYRDTDSFRAGVRLGLQHKFGLGPFAPVLQLDTALVYKAATLAADRGWTTEAGLRLAKRFTSQLKAGLRGSWLEHGARHASFDLQQRSLSLDASWDISERWSLSGSASRLSGTIVANAAPTVWSQALSGGLGPVVATYYNSRPWEVTSLYGPGWVSYNVEAHVDLWSLAAACAVTGKTTLEFRHGSAHVVNKIGISYPTESWGLSLVHRF